MVNKKAIELAILWHFSQFNTILLDYKKIDQRSNIARGFLIAIKDTGEIF